MSNIDDIADYIISLIKYIVGIYVIYAIITTIIQVVPVKHMGMVTRLGKVHIARPGINVIIPYIDHLENINIGFDTDFKDTVYCVSKDNIVLNFPRIYIDNKFSCSNINETCFTDLYINYFISDTKTKAKYTHKIVPEEGTIFKHISQAMAIACADIYAYETRKNWHFLYPAILNNLRKMVPNGIDVIAVRTDQPKFKDIEFRTSIAGIISSKIYVAMASLSNKKMI